LAGRHSHRHARQQKHNKTSSHHLFA
jgi:hypothetical protein